MKKINEMVLAENRELHEDAYQDTNVELDDDYFISEFIDRQGANWVTVNSDGTTIRPYHIPAPASNQYHFSRDDLACTACVSAGVHPQTTKVHLGLIDIIENARAYLNFPIDVSSTHLCANHIQANRCVLNTVDAARLHHRGLAVDLRPSGNPTTQQFRRRCRDLWRILNELTTNWFNTAALERGGHPSQDTMPVGFEGMRLRTLPAALETTLNAGGNIPNTVNLGNFWIHLEYIPQTLAETAADTTPLDVRLAITLESLVILDDQDIFAAGEWEISAKVNNQPFSKLSGSYNSGDTVKLGGTNWRREVVCKPDHNEKLKIDVTAIERDLIFDDKPGNLHLEFDADSSPAWGIGLHTYTSPTGAYQLMVRIESLNAEVTTI